jgi:hypothetical protein
VAVQFVQKFQIMPKMSLIIVSCTTATGQTISPTILLEGKCSKPECNDRMPTGMVIMMTVKANITGEVFTNRYSALQDTRQLRIRCLFLTELRTKTIRAAGSLGVIHYCLPSKTTH